MLKLYVLLKYNKNNCEARLNYITVSSRAVGLNDINRACL